MSGVKFIPRDKLQAKSSSDSDCSPTHKKKQKKHRKSRSKRRKHYNSSDISDDEEEDRRHRRRRSKKRPKWESSPSSSSPSSSESEKPRRRKRDSRKSSRKSSEREASSSAEKEIDKTKSARQEMESARKEMGLEWMVRPSERPVSAKQILIDKEPSQDMQEENPKMNPKELNPFFKGGGSGYPEEDEDVPQKAGAGKLPPPPPVGDGGASWRLKALKRAQEQAAREGRKLDEVVEERWGSLAQITASVATTRAASGRAHLHAIRDRKREQKSEHGNGGHEGTCNEMDKDDQRIRDNNRDYLRDVSLRESHMKAPKINDSLSWRNKKKGSVVRPEDAEIIRTAATCLNKFSNDGSFLQSITKLQNKEHDISSTAVGSETERVLSERERSFSEGSQTVGSKDEMPIPKAPYQRDARAHDSYKDEVTVVDRASNVQSLTANQLAAKAMQLRLKGKHAEADELLKKSQNTANVNNTAKEKNIFQADIMRSDKRKVGVQSKQSTEDDADANLASKIIRNKQYKTATQADDMYDYDDILDTRERQKKINLKQQMGKNSPMKIQKRIITQQERCQLCFENPSRPKHLTISIANFTYLMLPSWEPVVTGHCYILPMQHEASTRNLDDNEWEELRNFKKCLLRMYAEEGNDVIFLETALGLAQQRRHCLVECIPVPYDIAQEAPLYFKKAIDEAESEWSQHNAKKLIDTSIKGLRGSIPKNFPYFHVEFGMQKGFVHVIDDEKNFKSQFGLNVIRGMLQLREEDMYRHRQRDSLEMQRKAVSDFGRKWEPYDWTKMLD